MDMFNAKAYSAASATSPLASTTIGRRDPTEHDVQIEILYCGICHSDLHQVRNEWSGVMPTVYPCVPGHEIVGRVTKVGSAVSKFKPGDLAAVGCMVDSDGTCPECKAGLEQFCPNITLTYNSPDKHLGGVTYGGYSDSIVVDQQFVLRVPTNLELAGAAPLLCAGITTYSPMRHWGVTKGKKVGVVGLGGLGHMAREVCARARSARCCLHHFTEQEGRCRPSRSRRSRPSRRTPTKCKSTPAASISFSTPSPPTHDINAYIDLSAPRRQHHARRRAEKPLAVSAFGLIMGRRSLSGFAHRRHRRNPGDARLLRQAQHHLRCRSHPDPEGQRSLRETAQVRCEVPLLDRHGVAQIQVKQWVNAFGSRAALFRSWKNWECRLLQSCASEEARHRLARHYLYNSVLELNEAAYLLGYEDSN